MFEREEGSLGRETRRSRTLGRVVGVVVRVVWLDHFLVIAHSVVEMAIVN